MRRAGTERIPCDIGTGRGKSLHAPVAAVEEDIDSRL